MHINQLPMETFETPKEHKLEIAHVRALPEETVEEVRAKKEAFGKYIEQEMTRVSAVHNESGDNGTDDQGQEDAEDIREKETLMASDIEPARSEMARLGQKEYELLNPAA